MTVATLDWTCTEIDAICIYISTHPRNYHMRLLWSPNRYYDWTHTEIWRHLHIHMYSFQKLPYEVALITKQISWLNSHWNLMAFAYTCVLISEITILGYSDHQIDIMIEFTLKFDAIFIYICTCSRNYHIRLVWSPNRYHSWIPTEIWCNFYIQLLMSSPDTLHSLIFNPRSAYRTPSGVMYNPLNIRWVEDIRVLSPILSRT